MTIVKQLLDKKGHQVWTVHPDDTVLRALEEMANRNVGAVVVVEDTEVVGIFTERLYARDVFLKGRSSPTTRIREVMRANPAYVRPDHRLDECMGIMSAEHVRHLPVMDAGKLVGIVSIGDLLKTTIADKEFDIAQLVSYISRTR